MKRIHSISFKYRLAISYSIILALILAAGVGLLQSAYQRLKREVNVQTEALLSSSVRQIDSLQNQLADAARQIASSSTFRSLAASQDPDDPNFSYAAYQTQQDLKFILPLQELITQGTPFIYMESNGYVISASNFSDFQRFARYDAAYEPFQSGQDFLNQSLWERFIPLGTDDSDSAKEYLYLIPVLTSPMAVGTPASSVLCFRFDRSVLDNAFSGIADDYSYIAKAFDANGALMLSFGSPELSDEASSLAQLDYQDGAALYSSKDQGQMLSISWHSDNSGWTYYLAQPASQAYYSVNNLQRLATVVAGAAVLIEAVFIIFFTVLNSQPVNRLSNALASQESLTDSLASFVEEHKPLIAESYIRRLMEGSITTNEEMAGILEELKLNRSGFTYQVLYTEATSPDGSPPAVADLQLYIQNYDILVKEALRRYFPDTGYIYKPGDRIFACLIAHPTSAPPKESEEEVLVRFRQFHEELLTKYNIWITGGLGEQSEIVSYIWKSYQQAKNARSITTQDRFVLNYSDFLEARDVYYFPESMAVQLSGFISTGNKAQVESIFRQIEEENTSARSLSYTQFRWLLTDIRNTVFRKRRSLDTSLVNTPEKTQLLDLVDRQFEGDMSLHTLETISLELCDLYGASNGAGGLIVKIQEYINQNYMDPSLSLTRISEEFHISENYFSYLFKREVSENFSTYLEKLRMAKAKELVTESDTSISDLYQYVGYNNAASFRRVFKKNFGVSPREMRDKVNPQT
ncbi:MAG: helix-turn-helix domain-containing protein [Lachnospiraceae bacterium]|nr:helix-turn-helix domain-containing protein [Lachnospiraceae bacterium]